MGVVGVQEQVCVLLDVSDCIIEALANPAKERLKHEDTTVSQWLQGELWWACAQHSVTPPAYHPHSLLQGWLRSAAQCTRNTHWSLWDCSSLSPTS